MKYELPVNVYRNVRFKLMAVAFGTVCCLAMGEFFCDSEAWAFSQAKTTARTGIEVSKSKQSSIIASWSSGKDDQLTFQFKTIPGDGLKINSEGPWSLELKDHSGLDIEKTKLKRQEFDEKISGFSFTAKPKSKNGTIAFKMITFVCTENKTQCFRNVQQGSFEWQSK